MVSGSRLESRRVSSDASLYSVQSPMSILEAGRSDLIDLSISNSFSTPPLSESEKIIKLPLLS